MRAGRIDLEDEFSVIGERALALVGTACVLKFAWQVVMGIRAMFVLSVDAAEVKGLSCRN